MMAITSSRPLVLASSSPRRRELLASFGIPLFVLSVDVDESELPGERVDAYLARIVEAKLARARALAPEEHAAIVVADTVVAVDGDILGKPVDDDAAIATVSRIAGRTHQVMTRFAVGAGERTIAHTVRTEVTVRALDAASVRAYAASGEGRDKAGAYAIQGRFGLAVQAISGSYSNVVGLPVAEVIEALEELGLLDTAALLGGPPATNDAP